LRGSFRPKACQLIAQAASTLRSIFATIFATPPTSQAASLRPRKQAPDGVPLSLESLSVRSTYHSQVHAQSTRSPPTQDGSGTTDREGPVHIRGKSGAIRCGEQVRPARLANVAEKGEKS
jgi:hypothetical protein